LSRLPGSGRAGSCPRKRRHGRISFFTISNSPVGWAKARNIRAFTPVFAGYARRAHAPADAPSRGAGATTPGDAWARREDAPLPTLRFNSLLAIVTHRSLLPIRYSPFATRSLFIRHPEGWAERRWRSDACEAPVSACHDRHADASLDLRRPPRPACVLCAPRASPACDRFPHIGQARRFFAKSGKARHFSAHRASPTCVRAVRRLAFPATGRSPFGAPRGISGPGPCSPLSGGPSGIVRRPCSTHGSSLPGGAGLASLPGAAANRIRGHHSLAPPCKNASRSAPHERGWKESSIASYWGQQKNSNRSQFYAGA
jgi:hypothetical protein